MLDLLRFVTNHRAVFLLEKELENLEGDQIAFHLIHVWTDGLRASLGNEGHVIYKTDLYANNFSWTITIKP